MCRPTASPSWRFAMPTARLSNGCSVSKRSTRAAHTRGAPEKRSILLLLLRQFRSPLIHILFAAAALVTATGTIRQWEASRG
ncbi:cation-transporting P-type ATPase [Pseudoduganella namucuonensis]|uniref:cation-transporting P-type ATPase n=1 Tax=Pseudoduganella namucuonensis TaxID=1035707 RepID=UPI000B81A764